MFSSSFRPDLHRNLNNYSTSTTWLIDRLPYEHFGIWAPCYLSWPPSNWTTWLSDHETTWTHSYLAIQQQNHLATRQLFQQPINPGNRNKGKGNGAGVAWENQSHCFADHYGKLYKHSSGTDTQHDYSQGNYSNVVNYN